MERIVNKAPNLSAKKLESDFRDTLKYKKMKDRTLALSVEKILEKKKKYI